MSIQIIAFISSIAFLYFAKNIFIPVVLGIFLYFLLDPIVERLETKYLVRAVLSPVLVTFFVGALMVGAWVTYLTAAEIASHIPEYSEKVKNITDFFITKIKIVGESTAQLFPELRKERIQKVEIVQTMGDVTSSVLGGLDAIFGMMGSILIVPILTLFLLIERKRIEEKLKAFAIFSSAGKGLAEKITRVVNGFFIGNLIAGLASSLCFFAIFALIGLDNNIALSIGSGFLNLFPIIGSFLAMVFPLAQALLQFDSFGPFLSIIISSIVVHFIVGNLLLPKLMGSRVDLNVTAATLGMLFWGWLWGPLGIFLAVPLTAVIKIICGLSEKSKPFEIALSQSVDRPSFIILAKSINALKRMSSPQAMAIEDKIDADKPIF